MQLCVRTSNGRMKVFVQHFTVSHMALLKSNWCVPAKTPLTPFRKSGLKPSSLSPVESTLTISTVSVFIPGTSHVIEFPEIPFDA